MPLIFKHPPIPNPFSSFYPTNPQHYPTCEGVYVFGMKLDIQGQGQKFVPMYVGNTWTRTLKERLYNEHYKGLRMTPIIGNSKKELFDFSQSSYAVSQLLSIYACMALYNRAPRTNTGGGRTTYVAGLNNLIYYQDSVFFNRKYGIALPSGNFGQQQIIGLLPTSHKVKKEIIKTKENFTDKFYYVYACYDEIIEYGGAMLSKKDKEDLEYATKQALSEIGIHTTAKANKKIGAAITVDLTNIQNELVNLGSPVFASSKLIIQIP